MNLYRNYIIIIVAIALAGLSGCATQTPYFKLDSSLQKEVRSFNGTEYLSLARLCDTYGLDYKWDSFIKTATITKRNESLVLRAGSPNVLINDRIKKLEDPVLLEKGVLYAPMSFVKNTLAPIIAPTYAVVPEREAVKGVTIRTIVLDPGHGGKDVGAMGRRLKLREKDGTLKIALKVRSILEKEGIKVIMTRESDAFVSLSKRAQIANKNKADLFVSIHINASRARSLRGFECYYLSNATDDNARALEALENASLEIGDEAVAEHSSELDKTLWDMTLSENRRESSELAGYICDSIERSFTMGNRGTRSARFYVLKYTHMPAVLVEAGYISNKYEEMKLKDPEFLNRIAEAVAQGISKYKDEYERTEGFTK